MLQYLTALFYFDGETGLAACVLRATTEKSRQLIFEEKVHPGDLAGGFSDLEITFTVLALQLGLTTFGSLENFCNLSFALPLFTFLHFSSPLFPFPSLLLFRKCS